MRVSNKDIRLEVDRINEILFGKDSKSQLWCNWAYGNGVMFHRTYKGEPGVQDISNRMRNGQAAEWLSAFLKGLCWIERENEK